MQPAGTRRLSGAMAASVAMHALALGVVVRVRPTGVPSHPPVVIPISLVRLGGGGAAGGGGGSAPAAETPPPPLPAPVPTMQPTPPPTPKPAPARRPVPPRRARKPAPHPAVAATTGLGGSGGKTGTGTGTGAGAGIGSGAGSGTGHGDGPGDGSGGARVAYGSNPLPPYPLAAKRLGLEGVVTLDVLVRPDGRATDVRIATSSGHAMLDESAVATVRERWRFVPARRDGVAVEDRVRFPIRFRLTGR